MGVEMKVRKNYFVKMLKYTKNVYNIEHGFGKMQDGRVNPKYKTSTVLLTVLLGLMLRVKSFNELNYMIKENEFKNLFQKGTGMTLKTLYKINSVEVMTAMIFIASNFMQMFYYPKFPSFLYL